MKIRSACLILIAALIFLSSSCGIPSVYVPSSADIVIDKGSDGEFTILLSSPILSELSSSSPVVYFFYTISQQAQETYYSSAISSFNSQYAEETSGSNISTTMVTQPFISYTSSSSVYGIYQLTNLVSIQIPRENSIALKFEYDSATDTVRLKKNDGSYIENIKRFNDYTFSKDDFDEHNAEIVDYASGVYDIKIYAVVSCQFNSYNNIYNTKLSLNSPVWEYQMTL